MSDHSQSPSRNVLGNLIFLSRWLQAPLYLGLIIAQGIYVYQFFVELYHLISKVFIHPEAKLTEADIMTAVLGLIDVVMIANLLVMVIVGGYETFVSRLRLQNHPDQPEWLSHVNAGVLKVKLATALIGISSIHLLRSFIQIGQASGTTDAAAHALTHWDVFWQIMVHLTFVISALLLALTDRISTTTAIETRHKHTAA